MTRERIVSSDFMQNAPYCRDLNSVGCRLTPAQSAELDRRSAARQLGQIPETSMARASDTVNLGEPLWLKLLVGGFFVGTFVLAASGMRRQTSRVVLTRSRSRKY